MHQFEITEQNFIIDGKKQPLLCGEIHYFRMDRQYWEKALDLLVEAGCNAVAYYVPWFVHEYDYRKFDFTGAIHPDNDLHAWIALTRKKGLMGFLRPGPYVYAETSDLGIPSWFTEKFPDARVKKYEDGVYRNDSVFPCAAHNNPDFLREVSVWYEHLLREIRQYLAPEGNVVMVQLCNEIPCDDNNDHNPVTLGIGREDGIYPSYLRAKYGDPKKLNAYYGLNITSFAETEPYMLEAADREKAEADRLEFYYTWYYPQYFRTLRGFMQENGADTYFIHNAYNPRAVSLHYHNKKQNPWLNIGVDCYYSLNGRPGMREAVYYCEYGAEYIRRFLHNVPWVIEQESGYWNDFPQVYGQELYIWNICTMAAGYQGMNMYLFASGVNRPGMGFYGTDHNWQAPVDEIGNRRESFDAVKHSIEDIRKNEEIFLEEVQGDISFGIKNDPGLIWKKVAKPTDEMFFALKLAGFTPEICDFMGEPQEVLNRRRSLVLVCDQTMDEQIQRKLLTYVEQGGRLVISGRLPLKDTNGKPCTILADALGVNAEDAQLENDVQEKLVFDRKEYYVGKRLQPVGAKEEQIVAVNPQGRPAAVSGKIGEGYMLVLPFAMEVQFFSQSEMVRRLLETIGIIPSFRGLHMLLVLPKVSGDCVVINIHPVEVTEELVWNGRKKKITLLPYSFMIWGKGEYDE